MVTKDTIAMKPLKVGLVKRRKTISLADATEKQTAVRQKDGTFTGVLIDDGYTLNAGAERFEKMIDVLQIYREEGLNGGTVQFGDVADKEELLQILTQVLDPMEGEPLMAPEVFIGIFNNGSYLLRNAAANPKPTDASAEIMDRMIRAQDFAAMGACMKLNGKAKREYCVSWAAKHPTAK